MGETVMEAERSPDTQALAEGGEPPVNSSSSDLTQEKNAFNDTHRLIQMESCKNGL